jgi:Asp-tRNA(Asn)/Glu-tRNA(Gln) amidotransferase A subunit family amidase
MARIHELTMVEPAAAIRAGELSPVAVTDHYLRRTQELNDRVGAFFTWPASGTSSRTWPYRSARTWCRGEAGLTPGRRPL